MKNETRPANGIVSCMPNIDISLIYGQCKDLLNGAIRNSHGVGCSNAVEREGRQQKKDMVEKL